MFCHFVCWMLLLKKNVKTDVQLIVSCILMFLHVNTRLHLAYKLNIFYCEIILSVEYGYVI